MKTPTASTFAPSGKAAETTPGRPAQRSRRVAWMCASLGALTGLVMGLWSFDGPVPVPAGLGDYGSTARRLARLGHIAFFGLAILNLLLAAELDRVGNHSRAGRLASAAMNFGNVGLPVVLFGAAVWAPLKYLLPLPAMAVTIALLLAARGLQGSRPPTPFFHEKLG